MKRLLCFVLSVFFVLGCFTPAMAAVEPDLSISVRGVYLEALDTEQILYEKNADQVMAPASMTKVMTAIVVMELCEDLDKETITAPSGIYNEFAGINVSTANILAGETYTVRQLLYCMMLQSANEAASIVADYYGNGNKQAFFDLMNQKAAEIGCQNTHFANAHGLDAEGHYSTPRDMALICKYAMKIPGFMEIVSSTRYSIPATPKQAKRILVTTIKPQDSVNGGSVYNPYIKGIKTGSTDNAGRCFASTYTREGENYLCIVMGAPYEGLPNKAFIVTNELYDWAWRNFLMNTVIEKGELVHETEILYSFDQSTLLLESGADFSLLLPVGADASSIQKTITLHNPQLEAPINKGDVVGEITLKLEGKTVGTVPLLSGATVERSNLLYVLYQIKYFFSSTPAKIAIAIVVLLALGYIVLLTISLRNHKKRGGICQNSRSAKKMYKHKKYK